MQVDIFCNRDSRKVIKGEILEMKMLDDNPPTPIPHVCLTLNTGYNVSIELDVIRQINRFLEEENIK